MAVNVIDMTDFICPHCLKEFDDLDFEDIADIDNIRDEGMCFECEESC